ncbi:MAG: hypothetical protein REI09_04475 [Candidatus Dactylopiibacterium sp.]|nr:hypothetical protein [Candidatus Dactylopiibacterium sp.]
MTLEWIGIVFLALGLLLLWSAPERLLGLQILACVFAGSAALGLPALGGATVAPALASLAVLFACVLRYGHFNSLLAALAPGRAGAWLLALCVWGVLSAFLMPRLFAGEVDVISMDRNQLTLGLSVPLIPLAPGTGNLTQTAYVAGEVFVFAVALVFLRLEGGLERAGRAVLWLAAINLLAAAVDLFGYYAGLGNLLAPLQTASYAFMPEASFGGIKRINGTFPEASAFAGFTLPVLAFCYVMFRENLWRRASGPLAIGTLAALLLSTSSSGYAGLAIYGLTAFTVAFVSGSRRGGQMYVGHYVRLTTVALLAVTALLVLLPGLREQAWSIIESTLLYKGESASALERGEWNRVSWQAFLDTWGLGAGLGSARASSLSMVLASNLGLPGIVLFAGFIAHVLFARLPAGMTHQQRVIVIAARHAVLANLIVATISASVFDLGVLFYVFCAISCCPALLFRSPSPAPAAPAAAPPLEARA